MMNWCSDTGIISVDIWRADYSSPDKPFCTADYYYELVKKFLKNLL
eukprot:UN17195